MQPAHYSQESKYNIGNGSGLESTPSNISHNTATINQLSNYVPAENINAARTTSLFRYNRKAIFYTLTSVLVLGLSIGSALIIRSLVTKNNNLADARQQPSNYTVSKLPIISTPSNNLLQLAQANDLVINGQMQITNDLILSPTNTPSKPTKGQIYVSNSNGQPYYYNGSAFLNLLPSVLSVQGLKGQISFKAGNGITINGTTISNTGVVSLRSGSSQITINNDGQGNYTVSLASSGGNVVTNNSTVNVSSLDGQIGALNIADSTNNNGTISIQNASTSQPGLAAFNPSSFITNNGVVSLSNTSVNPGTYGSPNTTTTFTVNGQGQLTAAAVIPITISTNQIQTGNYISALGTLTGLSVNGNNGTGATPNLTIDYGAGPNTSVQGNTTIVCPSGNGNLTNTGNSITLGSGGTCNPITMTSSPVFSSTTLGSASQSGALLMLDGTSDNYDLQISTSTLTGNTDIIMPSVNGTVCLENSSACGFASTSGNNNYVNIQLSTPGTAQNGNFNITGTGVVGTALIGSGGLSDTGSLTTNGIVTLQDTTNSVTAFSVQTASGGIVLRADTANGRVGIDNMTPEYALDINGDINTTGLYRVNGTPISSQNLSDATNIGLLNANQTFTGWNTFKNTSNAESAFRIQNTASDTIFTADTADNRIGINTPTPSQSLDLGQSNNIAIDLSAPDNISFNTSSTGGSLIGGTTYYYEITAISAMGGSSNSSTEASFTVPTGTNTNTIILNWSSVPGAVEYNIYRGTTSGLENIYYTSYSNNFIDTGTTGTAYTVPFISNTTPGSYNYTVPSGVYALKIDASGAQGGNSIYAQGGQGARVQDVIQVTPGEVIYYNIGGQGTATTGGFNGGGIPGGGGDGGGGGGATDIRIGGTALSNRILVAGGGGGSGGEPDWGSMDVNGGAGGLVGANGSNNDCTTGNGDPGFGATQSAGGGFGTGCNLGATAGSLGQGGNGATAGYASSGGGGGGYYGGGGGNYGGGYYAGGGGGGSSYVNQSYTNGTPSYTTGYRSGDGYINIFPDGIVNTSPAYVNFINSSGNSYFLGGNLGIGTSNPSAQLNIQSESANNTVTKLQGDTGQTADILDILDSNGVVLSSIDANGNYLGNGVNFTLGNLAVPSFTTASSGTSYYYAITAYDASGETVASNSLGMANSTSALAWTQIAGAEGYKIYRNTTNNFSSGSLLAATISNGTQTTWTDTGTTTTTGLPPTSAQGSSLILQAWLQQSGDLLQAKSSSGSVLASIDSHGNLSVQSAIINGSITIDGHVIFGGSSPSITATTGTASIVGTDATGMITVTTGTSPAAGALATITFNSPYTTSPFVIISSEGPGTAGLNPYISNVATTSFTINALNAPSANTSYSFYYYVDQ